MGALAGDIISKHHRGHWVFSECVFVGITITVWDVLMKRTLFARRSHPLLFLLNFTFHFDSWIRHFSRDDNLTMSDGLEKT